MSEYPKSTYIQKRKASQRKERECQQHEDNVKIIIALNRAADELMGTKKQEKSEYSNKAFREYLTIILIFATVFATFVSDYIFHKTLIHADKAARGQLWALNEQTRAMQGQLQESRAATAETRREADAAEKQVGISSDSERRQVRAYAFPTPLPVLNFTKDQSLLAGVLIKSMGQTPAYKVRGNFTVRGMPYPLRDDFDIDVFIKPDQIQNSAFISPSNNFTLAGPWGPLDQITIDAINDGTKFRLYTWGRIDYEDVFTDPHWFTFCYIYDGRAIRDHDRVETCPRHNDDDHH